MSKEQNRRLALNTIYLYIRLGIGTIISLYTSRLVLEQLGVEGYGVYTVVGSVVLSLGFFSNSITNAISRFFAFELGKENYKKLREIFTSTIKIELALGLILMMILLTAGAWFIEYKLSLPDKDRFAAYIVLLTGTVSFFFTIVLIPYKSAVMTNEKFGVYAFVELSVVVLKLLAVISLAYVTADKLIVYSILMAVIISLGAIAYAVYGSIKFEECRFIKGVGFKEIKPIVSYAGIDLFSHFCGVVAPQSLQWIVNLFFGVAVNAAMGVTNQVTGALSGYISSLTQAFRPQIIKDYAAGNISRVQKLTENCSMCMILMMGMAVIPLNVNLPFVLHLWLKEVPPDTVAFCFIALFASIPGSLIGVSTCTVHATGKIKWMSFLNGLSYLLIPLLSYVMLKSGVNVRFIYLTVLLSYTLQWLNGLFIGAHYIEGFSAWKVLGECVTPFILLAILFFISISLESYMGQGWACLIVSTLLSIATCGTYGITLYRKLKKETE